MAQAVSFLLAKKVSRIILARPAVEAGEKLGFLPGDLQEKVNPYLRPLYDALYDMLDVEKADRFLERGVIEVAPLAFMRGRTLNDAFVILDEAQNTTSEQMKMFLTRLGFGSKAVVTGDVTQIDLPSGRTSGPDRGRFCVPRYRGHRVRVLRRARRGSPQAGAVDRQGVRRARRPRAERKGEHSRHLMPGALAVSVIVEGGGSKARAAAAGLDRWLSRVAPGSARGSVGIAIVTDRRMQRLNFQYPTDRQGDRRALVPQLGEGGAAR